MTSTLPSDGRAPAGPRPTSSAASLPIDWEGAGRWGGRLASPGPTASRSELEDMVAELHDAAVRARTLALRASRLGAAIEASGRADAAAQVLVVDRPGWTRAAAQSFAGMTASATAGAVRGSGSGAPTSGDAPPFLRGGPATAQAAALLGLLAGRVLGQFDPFAAGAPPSGRLLLVAPNLLRTERAMTADPADFRLWVAVHEQTHALQFAAAPWLADHLRDELAGLVSELAASSASDELGAALGGAVRALRRDSGDRTDEDDVDELGLLGLVLDAEQRARVDRVTAVMSVLEGHADVAMDSVGRRAIPTARRLRSRFDARRRRATGLDRVLRRLLGMDAKLAQYRRGAAFVRAVRRAGGRDALDAVWTGPQALPTSREIADPRAWVRRVHG